MDREFNSLSRLTADKLAKIGVACCSKIRTANRRANDAVSPKQAEGYRTAGYRLADVQVTSFAILAARVEALEMRIGG